MKRAAWLVAASLALTSCLPPTPKPVSLAQYEPPPSPYKDLTVAVILSPNTMRTVAHGKKWAGYFKAIGAGAFSMDERVANVVDILKRDFNHAMRAESLTQGVAGGADVIAVLDWRPTRFGPDPRYKRYSWIIPYTFYAAMIKNVMMYTNDIGLIFFDAEGRKIETVRVVSKYYSEGNRNTENLNDAFRQAQYDLEAALVSSDALRQWTANRAAKPASAETVAASDVDEPGYLLPESEDRFAVVVGVDGYSHADSARFAERDALAVKSHLLALGYPQRNIAYVTGSRAGRAGIEKYVESWLPERVGPKSKVLFYFAGHGSPDPTSGNSYLLPHDGDPRFLSNTGYPLKRLYEKLGTLKAQSVVAMLDTGFSGTGGRSVLPKGTRPLIAARPAFSMPRNLSVLEAAGDAEQAGVYSEQGHGLLTYHVLKSLQARKGEAKLGALFDEAAKGVSDVARRDGRDQTPRYSGPRGAAL